MDDSTSSVPDRNEAPSSTPWSLWLLLLAAAVVLIVVRSRPGPDDPLLNRSLPPLEAAGWLNTVTPPTAASLRGQVVLVDFWETSCIPCLEQMPDLVKIYERYRDQGLVLLGITPDPPQALPAIRTIVQRFGMNWPIGYGSMITLDVMGIEAVPTLVLFDGSGKSVWVGLGHHEGLDEAIVNALAEE